MKELIIGRKQQQNKLQDLYESEYAEFLVVYGRRRTGKTFLVREYFEGKFSFYRYYSIIRFKTKIPIKGICVLLISFLFLRP